MSPLKMHLIIGGTLMSKKKPDKKKIIIISTGSRDIAPGPCCWGAMLRISPQKT